MCQQRKIILLELRYRSQNSRRETCNVTKASEERLK